MDTPNNELDTARRIVENTGMHLFLTGKAGTGKTTFLKDLRQRTPKRMIITAPTGIAAINAGGVTLHSFFQLPFAPHIPDTRFHPSNETHRYRLGKEKIRIIRNTDLLVIDEISMVRADLLDAIDTLLRRYRTPHQPFGGLQLLMIGDLQQLAPVVSPEEWTLLSPHYPTPYFFSSKALSHTTYATIELTHTYRQTDPRFLHLLNDIRQNHPHPHTLATLNTRHIPNFTPPPAERYIHLTTHNRQAQDINHRQLLNLPTPAYTYKAHITGNFPPYSYPTDETLTLKQGAQVMFVKNDRTPDKRYYNGMIGHITHITPQGFTVHSKDHPHPIHVEPEQWDNTRYTLNPQTMEITEETEGSFRQYPVRLAWAITIHKSQGLTFSHAIIDASHSFAHGQVYVALSRCRTLEGLVLSTPLTPHSIINDNTIEHYTTAIAQQTPTPQAIEAWEKAYCHTLLHELFTFDQLEHTLEDTTRHFVQHLHRPYPQTTDTLTRHLLHLKEHITEVAHRFARQYTQIIATQTDPATSPHLQERLRQAATYFHNELTPIAQLSQHLTRLTTTLLTDNDTLKKRTTDTTERLQQACTQKLHLLQHVRDHGFHPADYLKHKAIATATPENNKKNNKKTTPTHTHTTTPPRTPTTPNTNTNTPNTQYTNTPNTQYTNTKKPTKTQIPDSTPHPDLYTAITTWRRKKATEQNLPAYCILQQKAIQGIVNQLPTTPDAMLRIPYFGKLSNDKYGTELLDIIHSYLQQHKLSTNIPDTK